MNKVTFKLDKNGKSQLTTIGDYAFSGEGFIANEDAELHNNDLTYLEGNPLFIPPSVTSIGAMAFSHNPNLKEIQLVLVIIGVEMPL